MDLKKVNRISEDRVLESENLLAEEKPLAKKKIGRPTTKKPGVTYKKVWLDLPSDLIKEANKYKVLNEYSTNSELMEAALRAFIK